MDIANSVEIPTGKIKNLPPPRTTQEEVRQSGFRKAFGTLRGLSLTGCLTWGILSLWTKTMHVKVETLFDLDDEYARTSVINMETT